ncbi:MAG: GrpB family protein [Anaerolineae bacterium]|uniref:GrpB family protein n=1 Tax=Promineifilum sp. TaxID=2664178 RepID=UPI001D345636|nr:GrpB family protein [Anaerolineales bacterium]MCB8934660.1 GrpB family protein [Promineifilum sp.]MCO5180982.1 GrpB family protein [Promineifilum sp.]MCW5846656.1 GrpB family protein [Anaerolineae bacterium]
MIIIVPYDPNWPAEFEMIRQSLEAALGATALQIDHIGSTSVANLGAKDVIDVQVTVEKLTPEIVERLTCAGYRYRPEITRDHVPPGEDEAPALWAKMCFNQPDSRRRANIHVRVRGNPNQLYPLLFRDYLRTHSQSAQAVERIKREIARRHADDLDAYYDIKDPVYDLVWAAAKEWAGNSR